MSINRQIAPRRTRKPLNFTVKFRKYNGFQKLLMDIVKILKRHGIFDLFYYLHIFIFSGCTTRLDLSFLLDASGSMTSDFDLIQQLARRIIHGLNFNNDRLRIGVTTFSAMATVRFHMNRYFMKESVLNAIAYTQDKVSGTNTQDALRVGYEDMFVSGNGDRSGVNNVLMLLTDGRSNVSPEETIPQANEARNRGIRVMAVGVGPRVDRAEINGMANNPEAENAFFIQDGSQLDAAANAILDVLCL